MASPDQIVRALEAQSPDDPQVQLIARLFRSGAPREQWQRFFGPTVLQELNRFGLTPTDVAAGQTQTGIVPPTSFTPSVDPGAGAMAVQSSDVGAVIDRIRSAGPEARNRVIAELPPEDSALLQQIGINPLTGQWLTPDEHAELTQLLAQARGKTLGPNALTNRAAPAYKYAQMGLLSARDFGVDPKDLDESNTPALLSQWGESDKYVREFSIDEQQQAQVALDTGDIGGFLQHLVGGAAGSLGRTLETALSESQTQWGHILAADRALRVAGFPILFQPAGPELELPSQAEVNAQLSAVMNDPAEARRYWKEQTKSWPPLVAGVMEAGLDPSMWLPWDIPLRMAGSGIARAGPALARVPGIAKIVMAGKKVVAPSMRSEIRTFADTSIDTFGSLARATGAKDGGEAMRTVVRFLENDKTLKLADETLRADNPITQRLRQVWGKIKNKDEFFAPVAWKRGDGSIISAEEATMQAGLRLSDQYAKKFPRDTRWGLRGFVDESALYRVMQGQVKFELSPFLLTARPAYMLANLASNYVRILMKQGPNVINLPRAMALMKAYPMLWPAYTRRGFGIIDEMLGVAQVEAGRKPLLAKVPGVGNILERLKRVNSRFEEQGRQTAAALAFFDDFSYRLRGAVEQLPISQASKSLLITQGMEGRLAGDGLAEALETIRHYEAGSVVLAELRQFVLPHGLDRNAAEFLDEALRGLPVDAPPEAVGAALVKFDTEYGDFLGQLGDSFLDDPSLASSRGFVRAIYEKTWKELGLDPAAEPRLAAELAAMAQEEDALYAAEGVVSDRWSRALASAPDPSKLGDMSSAVDDYMGMIDLRTAKYNAEVVKLRVAFARASKARQAKKLPGGDLAEEYRANTRELHRKFGSARLALLRKLESDALYYEYAPVVQDASIIREAVAQTDLINEQSAAAQGALYKAWRQEDVALRKAKRWDERDPTAQELYFDPVFQMYRRAGEAKLDAWAQALVRTGKDRANRAVSVEMALREAGRSGQFSFAAGTGEFGYRSAIDGLTPFDTALPKALQPVNEEEIASTSKRLADLLMRPKAGPLSDEEITLLAREVGIPENAISTAHGFDQWEALLQDEVEQGAKARAAVAMAQDSWARRIPVAGGGVKFDDVQAMLNTTLSQSRDVARREAEDTLFSYRYTKGDLWLNQLYMYPYWGIRYAVGVVKHVAQNPKQALAALKMFKAWDDETKDLPPSMRFSIRMLTFEDGTVVRFNPFTFFMPFGYQIAEIQRMGDEFGVNLQSFLELAQIFLGGQFNPALALPLRLGLDKLGVELPEAVGGMFGTVPPVEEQLSRVVPQQPLAVAAIAAAGEGNPLRGLQEVIYKGGLTQSQKRLIMHQIADYVSAGKATQAEGLIAMQDLARGVQNALAVQAMQDAMGASSIVKFNRYLGLPRIDYEIEYQNSQAVAKAYREATTDEVRNQIIKDNPDLPLRWVITPDLVAADFARRRAMAWLRLGQIEKIRDERIAALGRLGLDAGERSGVQAWYTQARDAILREYALDPAQVYGEYTAALAAEKVKAAAPKPAAATPPAPPPPPKRQEPPTERDKRREEEKERLRAETTAKKLDELMDEAGLSPSESGLLEGVRSGTIAADSPVFGEEAVKQWLKHRRLAFTDPTNPYEDKTYSRDAYLDEDGVIDWAALAADEESFDATVKGILNASDYELYQTRLKETDTPLSAVRKALQALLVDPFMAAPDKDVWKASQQPLSLEALVSWISTEYPWRFDPQHPVRLAERQRGLDMGPLWDVRTIKDVLPDGIPNAQGYLDIRTDEKIATLKATIRRVASARTADELLAATRDYRRSIFKTSNDTIVNEATIQDFEKAREEFNRWKFQQLTRETYKSRLDELDRRVEAVFERMSIADILAGKYKDEVNAIRATQDVFRGIQKADLLQEWTPGMERFFTGDRAEGGLLADRLRELVFTYWKLVQSVETLDYDEQKQAIDGFVANLEPQYNISRSVFEAELYKRYPVARLLAEYWFQKQIEPALEARDRAKIEFGGVVPEGFMQALGKKYSGSTTAAEVDDFIARFPGAVATIARSYGVDPSKADDVRSLLLAVVGPQTLPGFLEYWQERHPPRGGTQQIRMPQIPSGSGWSPLIPSAGGLSGGLIPGGSGAGGGLIPGGSGAGGGLIPNVGGGSGGLIP